ncbi:MAG: hypothetical protein WC657_08620 [Candidatus Paceibacterota bacterium]|jgi:hypothetical protein
MNRQSLKNVAIVAVVIAIFGYLSHATDGFKRAPELPYFSSGSREAPISLHSAEISKIEGQANFTKDGKFYITFHNGTAWTITRVDVVIGKNKTAESRRFRLAPRETDLVVDPASKILVEKKIAPVPVGPYSKGSLEAETGDFLRDVQSGEWSWNIAEIFGYRE